MKNITNFINESKNFKLNDYERDALSILIGFVTQTLGDKDVIDEFKEVHDLFTNDELKKLEDVNDYVLDKNSPYSTINRNLIKDEIPVFKKMIEYCDEHDIWDNIDDYELLNILDKINK